jgi:hypothetical protein
MVPGACRWSGEHGRSTSIGAVSKPWRIVLGIVAVLVTLGALVLGGRWMYGFTTDPTVGELERNAAGQVAQAGIAFLALVATALAALAAFQSKASAKASEQMVERARLAMSYHNRPTGSLGFESPQARQRHEDAVRVERIKAEAENRQPLGDSVINYLELGDTATATVTLQTETGARMSAIKLIYVTTDGRSHEVLLADGQPSAELEGVQLVSYSHSSPDEHLPPLAYSIRELIVECFDPETATTWRAKGTRISAHFYVGTGLTFDRVA